MKADELNKKLHETEPSRHEMLEYGWALRELAEGATARNLLEMLNHVTKAERYLAEFRGNMVPTPTLTADEAEFAIKFHTYMRKCMDCPLGTVLYRLIAENKGLPVWYAFVKSVSANKGFKNKKNIYHTAIRDAENVYHNGNDNTDSLLMLSSLRMWEDGFADAMAWGE